MTEQTKHVPVKSKDQEQSDMGQDFVDTVSAGIGRVMRDRNAMRGVEAQFDVAVMEETRRNNTTTTEVRDKLRKQLQDGRMAIESLENRLLHIITG